MFVMALFPMRCDFGRGVCLSTEKNIIFSSASSFMMFMTWTCWTSERLEQLNACDAVSFFL